MMMKRCGGVSRRLLISRGGIWGTFSSACSFKHASGTTRCTIQCEEAPRVSRSVPHQEREASDFSMHERVAPHSRTVSAERKRALGCGAHGVSTTLRREGPGSFLVTSCATSSGSEIRTQVSLPHHQSTRSFSSNDHPTSQTPQQTSVTRSHIIDFGTHKGKSYDEVVEKHPSYVAWLENYASRTPGIEHFLAYAAGLSNKHKDSTTPTNVLLPRTREEASDARRLEEKNFLGSDGTVADYQGAAAIERGTKRNVAGSEENILNAKLVTFGKYRGDTFEHVFKQDPTYCHFLATMIFEDDVSYRVLEFIVFCQQRWLEKVDDPPMNIQAPRRCLTGQRFCLVGRDSTDLPKRRIRLCLEFFGATIVNRVQSRCSSLLLISPFMTDGHPVEASTMYMDALERGVEIIPVEEFLQNRLHRPGDNTSTFV